MNIRVSDNHAGNGRLHQHVLPGAQGGERDDQFRQVSQRGIEQSADPIARLGRHRFGGVAQQRRQRDDGQNGQHEMQRVRFWFEFVKHEDQRDEYEQPKQRVVADFFEELFHFDFNFDSGPGRESFAESAGWMVSVT